MPETFLGDGLKYDELLPLTWTPGPLAQGLGLAKLNAENQQLLGAEGSLDDVRVTEALKEESPALVAELQRLEFKLNILLRLVADLASRNAGLPEPQAARLTAQGLEWSGDQAPPSGASGLLSAYINPALPQPLKLPANVIGERLQDGVRVAQLQFVGLSEGVVDALEKLIFRHHRRLVAGSRGTVL